MRPDTTNPYELLQAAAEWLEEASYDIADWGAYAQDYFQQKHSLEADMRKYQHRAAYLRERLEKVDCKQKEG